MEAKILVRRNIDCSNISESQFIEAMTEDLKNSVIEYDKYWKPIYEQNHKNNMEKYHNAVLKRVTKFAEKKWKTEKKRIAYIESKMNEIKDDNVFYYPNLTFFDFKLEPGKMGISNNCIIEINHPEKLTKCYNEIKNNKYFKRAQGWILESDPSFRSQIKLILPKDAEEEYENERKTLEKDIRRFYSGTIYFGD